MSDNKESKMETTESANITGHKLEKSSFEAKVHRGILFQEDGLYGLKDLDGTIIYPANYVFIGKCKKYVMLIDNNDHYEKIGWYSRQSGQMDGDMRQYMENGKSGMKVKGEVVIPAEYDFIKSAFGDDTVYYAIKDGRELYLNEKGEEVLTRVRRFNDENENEAPFYLCSNSLDYFTAMNYVGHPVVNNNNVIRINDEWVELERYCKKELMEMLINPDDDLPLDEENLKLMCNQFSYEFSFYFANASGKRSLDICMEQFQKMNAFCNSWYYIIKIWQAPGEFVQTRDLRRFVKKLNKNDVIGNPLFAVGHSESLKPGEVRVLMVTHYHERCWPARFEYIWANMLRTMPITQLQEYTPALRQEVEKNIRPQYKDEVFNDQLLNCIDKLKYYDNISWSEAEKALNYFIQLGSPVKHSLYNYLKKASRYISSNKSINLRALEFFLNAALWAINNGSDINEYQGRKSVLDYVNSIDEKNSNIKIKQLVNVIKMALKAKKAKTFKTINEERKNNTDYFKELEYMHIDGISEKSMPGLSGY